MPGQKFTNEERQAFYNAIINLDTDQNFVIADKENDCLSYTDKIKSRERISGTPSDEELTRALIILHLIHNYNYSSDRIEIESNFAIGGRRTDLARAVETDICILNDNNEIETICEIKRIQNYFGSDDSSIKNQLFTPFTSIVKFNKAKYLYHLSVDIPLHKNHFPLQCVGIDTSVTTTYESWESQGKTPHFVDINKSGEKPLITDVFVKLEGDEKKLSKKFKDLNENFGIDSLKRIWRNLWENIWGGTLEDNKKFENFNKVLLAKIYDERKTKIGTPYSFQRKFKGGIPQSEFELAQDIDLLYRKAYREYLSKDKSIELIGVKGIDFKEFSVSLTAKCVEQLQSISFHKNRYKNVDILGEFYEMVIRDAFKQTKGLFLTHPNIVLFILSALQVEELVVNKLKRPDEDIRYRLPFIIDPSCGTGTFLIHYMQYVQRYVEQNKRKISRGDSDISDFIEREMLEKNAYKWVKEYLYGIDNEPVLATACQINLILHGDGSTNIYNADGLDSFDAYSKMEVTGAVNILSSKIQGKMSYYSKDVLNKFDVIISNPPFNVNINRSNIQSNFEATRKSEAYFLERWYQLLKPGGRLGVVLPESFFSVEDDISARMFLYKHFDIKAIVSLPNHAFQPHTPTSTSILLARKKSESDELEFNNLWQENSTSFQEKYNKVIATIPQNRSNVNFDKEDKEGTTSVFKLVQEIETLCITEFGIGFVILPFFSEDFLVEEQNFAQVKKIIKEAILKSKDRWILHMVSKSLQYQFYNFTIENIGYKAGKKGSKDKPNELMAIYTKEGQRIYNLKYSHSWEKIDMNDMETVLGKLKELKIWQ